MVGRNATRTRIRRLLVTRGIYGKMRFPASKTGTLNQENSHPALASEFAMETEFDDSDTFTEAVRGWDLDFRQLGRGRMDARLAHVAAGPVFITACSMTRQIEQCGASLHGFRTIAIPASDERSFINEADARNEMFDGMEACCNSQRKHSARGCRRTNEAQTSLFANHLDRGTAVSRATRCIDCRHCQAAGFCAKGGRAAYR